MTYFIPAGTLVRLPFRTWIPTRPVYYTEQSVWYTDTDIVRQTPDTFTFAFPAYTPKGWYEPVQQIEVERAYVRISGFSSKSASKRSAQ